MNRTETELANLLRRLDEANSARDADLKAGAAFSASGWQRHANGIQKQIDALKTEAA